MRVSLHWIENRAADRSSKSCFSESLYYQHAVVVVGKYSLTVRDKEIVHEDFPQSKQVRQNSFLSQLAESQQSWGSIVRPSSDSQMPPGYVDKVELPAWLSPSPESSHWIFSCSATLATAFSSLSMASSSARSVVIICCSSLDALMMTGTLLLLLEIRASPRSNWVMLRISVRVSFRTSLTYSASSGSRFRIIFVFELLRMDLPYPQGHWLCCRSQTPRLPAGSRPGSR